MRKQRAVYLVWLLHAKIEPDYLQDELRYRYGVIERRLTKKEAKDKKKAYDLPFEEAVEMVDLDGVSFSSMLGIVGRH